MPYLLIRPVQSHWDGEGEGTTYIHALNKVLASCCSSSRRSASHPHSTTSKSTSGLLLVFIHTLIHNIRCNTQPCSEQDTVSSQDHCAPQQTIPQDSFIQQHRPHHPQEARPSLLPSKFSTARQRGYRRNAQPATPNKADKSTMSKTRSHSVSSTVSWYNTPH